MHKKFIKIFSILAILALTSVMLPACSGKTDDTLSFDDLIAHADQYNGKVVTFEAFFFYGFEIEALSGGLTHQNNSSLWTPTNPRIWFSGNIPQDVTDRFYTQTDTPSGYPERYGKIRITGTFQYGGAYGHLNAYNYQLVATGAVYLDWTPS
jgi:hypothetical protein